MNGATDLPSTPAGQLGRRMLVIDDEDHINAAVTDYFMMQGYLVDCAPNETAARALLDRSQYAVVITDLQLSRNSRMEGLDLVEYVRKRHPETVCIVLTAHGDAENRKEAWRRGADAFLQKPTPLHSLAALVAERLRGRPCRLLLRPIALRLLKSGITWKEFSEVARRSFVEAATTEFGIRGKPTSISRVAMLTGMTAAEVRNQHALIEADPDPPRRGYMSNASRVLSGWHQDPEFLDANKQPLPLLPYGEGTTFARLAHKLCPEAPPLAVLDELLAAGAVERLEDGRVRAAMRDYLPEPTDPGQLRLWAAALVDLGSTLEHNLSRSPGAPARFERRALNVRVAPDAVSEFRKFLESEGQSFLERVDDWLSAHTAASETPDDTQTIRLGCGVYQIEDVSPKGRLT